MKKTYIISFLLFLALGCFAYFGSYVLIQEKTKEDVTQQNEDILEADANTTNYTSDQTVYILEKYNAVTYELTEEKLTMPAEYVGLTRAELMEKVKAYEKNPNSEDMDLGFTGFSLVYFSENKVVLRKTYNKGFYDWEYVAKIDDQGKIVICVAESGEIYTDTDIYYHKLPEDIQEQIQNGKYMNGLREVYDFLENYSS